MRTSTHFRGAIHLAAAGSLLFAVSASRAAQAYTATCSSGTCQVNFPNGHVQSIKPVAPVGGQSSLTCATDADCQVLVNPSCPSFPICTDASDTSCATNYQTMPDGNGSCALAQDVIIAETIVLPSFVQLDCGGFSITPQSSMSGDCCPSNGTSTGCSTAPMTTLSCPPSTPELAIFLNGAYGVTIRNCSIGASNAGDAPFDFGILSLSSKSDASLAGDQASLEVLQNQIIDNPAIHARFGAVNLAFTDNTLVAGNPSIKVIQRGATAVFAQMSSEGNTIANNNISVDFDATVNKNFFTGAKRFPGPTATSNPIYSCGHGVNFSQFVNDNATCTGTLGKNEQMANPEVNGLFYQRALSSNAALTPATQANTLAGNQITIVPGNSLNGGTFGLKTTAPNTAIVQNTISGAFLAVGVAANAATASAPGTCGAGGPFCAGNDDCKNVFCFGKPASCAPPAGASTCVPSGLTTAGAAGTGVKIDGNQIFVPEYSPFTVSGAAVFPGGMNVSPIGAVITNNQITLMGSPVPSITTQGMVLGAGALEMPLATAATVTGNSISGLTNSLFLNDVNPAAFGAAISLNDFTGYAQAVRLSSPYTISSELSQGCRGNFWGITSAPAFNSSLVGGNPAVVDSHPYTFSVAAQSNPPVVDTTPPNITCPSDLQAPNQQGQCSASLSIGTTTTSDLCDSSPVLQETRSDGASLDAPYPVGTTTVTSTSTDASGNGASCQQVVKVTDVEAPSLTWLPTTAVASIYGWYGSDVPVPYSDADNCGGNVSASPLVLTAEGANVQGSVTACDAVPNCATYTSPSYMIDKTPPTIAFASLVPAANGAGWNNSDVTASWTCADALSGPVSPAVSTTLSSEGTNLSASGTCSDLAANTASDAQTGLNIDKTAPVGTITSPSSPAASAPPADCAAPATDILRGTVDLSAEVTDNLSGVKAVEFQIDALTPLPGIQGAGNTWTASSGFNTNSGLTADGCHAISATLTDVADNATTLGPAPFIVDNTPPSVSITAPEDGAYVRGAITIAVHAADATSGVASISVELNGAALPAGACSGGPSAAACNFAFDTRALSDGPFAITATAVDQAGNKAFATIQPIADNSKPVESILSPAPGQVLTTSMKVAVNVVDNSFASVECLVDGVSLGISANPRFKATVSLLDKLDGLVVVTCNALDKAGNLTTHAVAATERNWKEAMRPSRLSLESHRRFVGMAVKNIDRSLSNVSLLLDPQVLATLALVTPGGATPVVSAVPPGRADEGDDGDDDGDDPHHARVLLRGDGSAFIANLRAGIAAGTIDRHKPVVVMLVSGSHVIGSDTFRIADDEELAGGR